MEERNILSVSEITQYIKTLFETDIILNSVLVRGEISNLKHYQMGGQIYFTLKDENCQISCVIFKSSMNSIKFDLEEGMKVIIKGKISVYEKRGQYNFRVFGVEPDGIGALALAFEKLKKKLYEEGIFNDEHKKSLPIYPKRIAILASPTGAAVYDVIKVIKRRAPWIEIFVVPIIVQGDSAKKSIINGIKLVNKYGNIDLMILARGGGSLEELWAFNEEEVVRGVFASKIPIVSAIGHEVDVTLTDLAADLRAATPSQAGELVCQEKIIVLNNIENTKNKLKDIIQDILLNKKEELDDLCSKIRQALEDKLYICMTSLNLYKEKLNLLNPKIILKRGYSIVEKTNPPEIVKSSNQVKKQDRLRIVLYKGEISADVV